MKLQSYFGEDIFSVCLFQSKILVILVIRKSFTIKIFLLASIKNITKYFNICTFSILFLLVFQVLFFFYLLIQTDCRVHLQPKREQINMADVQASIQQAIRAGTVNIDKIRTFLEVLPLLEYTMTEDVQKVSLGQDYLFSPTPWKACRVISKGHPGRDGQHIQDQDVPGGRALIGVHHDRGCTEGKPWFGITCSVPGLEKHVGLYSLRDPRTNLFLGCVMSIRAGTVNINKIRMFLEVLPLLEYTMTEDVQKVKPWFRIICSVPGLEKHVG